MVGAMDFPHIIAENICSEMEARGIDKLQLVMDLGYKPETIERWLSGDRCVTAYGLFRIARYLGCTMEHLMDGCMEEEK